MAKISKITLPDGSTYDIGGSGSTSSSQPEVSYATLSSASWSANAPYTQTVSVAGMTTASVPVIGVSMPVNSTSLTYQQNAKFLTKFESGTNTLTATCLSNKPTVDIDIIIEDYAITPVSINQDPLSNVVEIS